MGVPISQRAYAKHRGVTHRAVQKAIAAGRIPVTADRKVDPDVADRAWASNTDEAKVRGTAPAAALPSAPSPMPVGPSGTSSSYQTARALHETYRARTARLEFERLSGALVPMDQVRVEAFTSARRVREAILSVPDRLSPVLAAMSDPADIHRTLLAELRQALEELARDQRT
ncbi:MAG TPA: hypothetical protein VL332_02075 [Candidatus Saccharimonadaceae bacterium]|nr:hypothetical protein [Candidatus Saccharimonadaceae bacterium]